jgi:hypothetical protein
MKRAQNVHAIVEVQRQAQAQEQVHAHTLL